MTEAATEDLPDAGPKPKQGVALALLFGTAAIGFALDQVTKAMALAKLGRGQVVEVVDHWLQFRLVRNAGAAFSLGESLTWAFTILAAVVVVGVALVARRVTNRGWAFALGLLVAGAAGNLSDRLFRQPGFGRGHVIDFIDYAGRFVGNVADIAIVAAMVMVVVAAVRGVGFDGTRQ